MFFNVLFIQRITNELNAAVETITAKLDQNLRV